MKVVEEAIEQMKRFKLNEVVDDSTTHVVCGDSRRTLNVMRGVVRGVKIVTLKWVRVVYLVDRNTFLEHYLIFIQTFLKN